MARVVSGCHLLGGHSICCHSNQLTTEGGDVDLSIQDYSARMTHWRCFLSSFVKYINTCTYKKVLEENLENRRK